VLASAFVFPGAGHIILKRYRSSLVLIITALGAAVVLITHAVNIAIRISKQIVNGEVEPNIFVIRSLITEQQSNAPTQWISIATWVLVATWLIGVLDAYRIGKMQEPSDSAK